MYVYLKYSQMRLEKKCKNRNALQRFWFVRLMIKIIFIINKLNESQARKCLKKNQFTISQIIPNLMLSTVLLMLILRNCWNYLCPTTNHVYWITIIKKC